MTASDTDYAALCTAQEHEVDVLERDLILLTSGQPLPVDPVADAKLVEELTTENSKLKYRLAHLRKHIQHAKDAATGATDKGAAATTSAAFVQDPTKGVDVLVTVKQLFLQAVRTLDASTTEDKIIVQMGRTADYQCNNAMALAKKLKKKPQAIAADIVAAIPANDVIAKLEVAGPGFINVHINTAFFATILADINQAGIKPPKMEKANMTAVVDFSSPNIAKQMHVGHLRSTIIGDTICRLLEFAGMNVLRMNHIGDWGTQFGMLIAHLKDMYPDYKKVSPPVGDLQAFYKASKVRFDGEPEFKDRAYKEVVKLQNGDPDVRLAWTLICDVSRQEYSKIYSRLNIKIEEKGESFYQPLMGKIVDEVKASGHLKLEDGRQVFYTDFDKVPLTVVKSDGGFTYATSDLTALKYRLDEQKADWAIYVVDSGQALHLNSVYAAGRMMNWYTKETKRIEHVGFGVVLGQDGKKFKTRSGDTVKLADLLDEAVKRSDEILREKGRDKELTAEEFEQAKNAVAYGAVKYADLCKSRTADYVFSFDNMLAFQGNTAVYILFAYMRIQSIIRKSNVHLADHTGKTITLTHDMERSLAKTVARFTEVTAMCMRSLEPHHMCDYLYKLAGSFTDFYGACRVIDENGVADVNRLLIANAVAVAMRTGLDILGIDIAEKM